MISTKDNHLYILEQMGIPVWRQKRTLPLKIIKAGIDSHYLLIVGKQGSWDCDPIHQAEKLNLIKRLMSALNFSFESCILAEFEEGQASGDLVQAIKALELQKIMIFGKNLGSLLELKNFDASTIVRLPDSTIQVAILPSIEALLNDPIQKKEAWGCLSPQFVNS